MAGTQWSAVLDAASMTYQGNLLTGYTEGVAGDQYSFTYDAQRRLQHATAVSWGTAATEYVPNLQQTYDQTFSFCSNSGVPVYTAAPGTCSGLGTLTGMRSPGVPDVVYQYGPQPQSGEQATLVSGGSRVHSDNVSYDNSDRGLITSVDGDQSVSSGYDPENRLTSSGTDTLSYDALGALAVRRVSGGSTYYYVGDHITVMVEGTVTTARAEILVGRRIASAWYEASTTALSQTTMYYHTDRLGSVVATSVTGGALKATYRYDPYGIVTGTNNDTGHFASDLGYTGGRRLSGGLIHLRARAYNPALRQFMQADDVDAKRYAYAGGDPINLVDPSGHMAQNAETYTSVVRRAAGLSGVDLELQMQGYFGSNSGQADAYWAPTGETATPNTSIDETAIANAPATDPEMQARAALSAQNIADAQKAFSANGLDPSLVDWSAVTVSFQAGFSATHQCGNRACDGGSPTGDPNNLVFDSNWESAWSSNSSVPFEALVVHELVHVFIFQVVFESDHAAYQTASNIYQKAVPYFQRPWEVVAYDVQDWSQRNP